MEINKKQIQYVVRMLMISDGILPSGFAVSDFYDEKFSVKNILKTLPADKQRKFKRKYRKVKKRILKEEGFGFKLTKIQVALFVKTHYIHKAKAIIAGGKINWKK